MADLKKGVPGETFDLEIYRALEKGPILKAENFLENQDVELILRGHKSATWFLSRIVGIKEPHEQQGSVLAVVAFEPIQPAIRLPRSLLGKTKYPMAHIGVDGGVHNSSVGLPAVGEERPISGFFLSPGAQQSPTDSLVVSGEVLPLS